MAAPTWPGLLTVLNATLRLRAQNQGRKTLMLGSDPGVACRYGLATRATRRYAVAGSAARAVPRRPGPPGAPRLPRPAAAVQRRLPGRGEHPGVAGVRRDW